MLLVVLETERMEERCDTLLGFDFSPFTSSSEGAFGGTLTDESESGGGALVFGRGGGTSEDVILATFSRCSFLDLGFTGTAIEDSDDSEFDRSGRGGAIFFSAPSLLIPRPLLGGNAGADS